jgi:hypothetical protein
MNDPEEVEAAEIARLERVFSKGGSSKPVTKSPVQPKQQPVQQQPDELKKSTSGMLIRSIISLINLGGVRPGVPAWKLKELEKERERKNKEDEEARKKEATAEAIQKRQQGYYFVLFSCCISMFNVIRIWN